MARQSESARLRDRFNQMRAALEQLEGHSGASEREEAGRLHLEWMALVRGNVLEDSEGRTQDWLDVALRHQSADSLYGTWTQFRLPPPWRPPPGASAWQGRYCPSFDGGCLITLVRTAAGHLAMSASVSWLIPVPTDSGDLRVAKPLLNGEAEARFNQSLAQVDWAATFRPDYREGLDGIGLYGWHWGTDGVCTVVTDWSPESGTPSYRFFEGLLSLALLAFPEKEVSPLLSNIHNYFRE